MQDTPTIERGFVAAVATSFITMGAFLVGCGAGNPPGEQTGEEAAVASNEMTLVSDQKQHGPKVCEPLSTRHCGRYWVDDSRVKHCEQTIQYCRRDGYGWHACGDLNAPQEDPSPSPANTADDGAADDAAVGPH